MISQEPNFFSSSLLGSSTFLSPKGRQNLISLILCLFVLSWLSLSVNGCNVEADCNFGEICSQSVCSDCQFDSSCDREQICNDSGQCVHKDLFQPFDVYDLILLLIIFISSALNAAVGVGGGTLYMPLLLILFFRSEEAVPLSNAMTTMAALAQVTINFQSRITLSADTNRLINDPKILKISNVGSKLLNPRTLTKPLIDYDICLIVSPLSSSGTILGSYLYRLFPDIILRIGLIIFLILLNGKIAHRALEEWREFEEHQLQTKNRLPLSDLDSHGHYSPDEESVPLLLDHSDEEEEWSPEVVQLMEKEQKIPFKKILLILVLFSIITVFNYSLKTPDLWPSNFEYCGIGYWMIFSLIFPFMGFVAYGIAKYFNRIHRQKAEMNYPFTHCQIEWEFRKVLLVSLFSVLAGAAAALFGIGGGVLFVPMMLELGLRPEVCSATSGFLIVLTSLASFLTHIFGGHFLFQYTLFFGSCSFVSAFIGVRGIKYALKKTGKSFLVLVVLFCALTASVLALSTYTIMVTSESFSRGSNPFANWGSVC